MHEPTKRWPTGRAIQALSWLWASCERVSRSESESLDRDPPPWERMTAGAHQLYCPGCRRFRRQMRTLSAALRQLRSGREASGKLAGLFLPPDARERIRAVLKAANDRGGPSLPGAPSD